MDSAFVDVPRGDLNHDGQIGYDAQANSAGAAYSKVQWSRYRQYEAWPTEAKVPGTGNFDHSEADGIDVSSPTTNVLGGWAAQVGEAHFQMECSGKGTCDRSLGVCNCYDGYTGGACQRTTCPNDCSGHGLCRKISEIALYSYNKQFDYSEAGVNYYSGILEPYEYRLWDSNHNAACACDPGYMGVDCSLRDCPRGNDPLTINAASCGGQTCQSEMQSMSFDGSQVTPGTYYLTFTDYTGPPFRTIEFPIYTDSVNDPDWDMHKLENENVVKARLETLPNNVTGTVSVSSSGGGADAKDQYRLSVTFSGKSGNLPEMSLGWTGTSNAATLRAYVFQPGQPVQAIYLDSSLGMGLSYLRILVYPQDQTLYGLPIYWQSSCTKLFVSNTASGEADVADNVVAALNSIPAVKLSFGSPFIRDSNVIAQIGNYSGVITQSSGFTTSGTAGGGGGYNIRIAFPDKQFGLAKIQANTYSDDQCTVPTGPTPVGKTVGEVDATPYDDVLDGNMEHVTCANRGLCDYMSGLCSCFSGYTGVSCEMQSTLAR